jgi:mannose-1-phosphate guanylyltransferase
MNVWAVVLAGGVGSRFWPLSTAGQPKQLLPLASDQPLLLDALERLRRVAPLERTLVLANATLAGAIAEVATDLPRTNLLAEPVPAGTAGALAWAALQIARLGSPADVMVCVHADWAIADAKSFAHSLSEAARVAAETGALVTVGVVPTRDDPGFGYVVPGEEHQSGARTVARFHEKPSRERAAELRRDGALWNSGIFAWRVEVFLDELRRHTPEVARALDESTEGAYFRSVKPVSVDVGLLERSSNVLMLSADFGWDDVGTWGALLRARAPDASGNVSHGAVHARDAERNVAYTTGAPIVLFGVSDLVVVSTGDVTLVTTPDRSADLKQLVEGLPAALRDKK